MPTDDATQRYAEFGLAAMLPGFQRAVDVMQAELNRMREQLAHLQNGNGARPIGGPRVTVRASRAWANLNPEERSAEMKRRMSKRSGKPAKREVKAGVRNAMSEAQRKRWAAKKQADAEAETARLAKSDKLSQARKAHWAGLSKRRQKEHLAKMIAGRRAKQESL